MRIREFSRISIPLFNTAQRRRNVFCAICEQFSDSDQQTYWVQTNHDCSAFPSEGSGLSAPTSAGSTSSTDSSSDSLFSSSRGMASQETDGPTDVEQDATVQPEHPNSRNTNSRNNNSSNSIGSDNPGGSSTVINPPNPPLPTTREVALGVPGHVALRALDQTPHVGGIRPAQVNEALSAFFDDVGKVLKVAPIASWAKDDIVAFHYQWDVVVNSMPVPRAQVTQDFIRAQLLIMGVHQLDDQAAFIRFIRALLRRYQECEEADRRDRVAADRVRRNVRQSFDQGTDQTSAFGQVPNRVHFARGASRDPDNPDYINRAVPADRAVPAARVNPRRSYGVGSRRVDGAGSRQARSRDRSSLGPSIRNRSGITNRRASIRNGAEGGNGRDPPRDGDGNHPDDVRVPFSFGLGHSFPLFTWDTPSGQGLNLNVFYLETCLDSCLDSTLIPF